MEKEKHEIIKEMLIKLVKEIDNPKVSKSNLRYNLIKKRV